MMNPAIQTMLSKYQCHSESDYINALKEIFQEISLLGLWRAKFFEHAAFYGGTALRILYGLDRFSEDLDFSLLRTEKNFSLEKYNEAVLAELQSFGFDVEVQSRQKAIQTPIESAFIKANTINQFFAINAPKEIINRIHRNRTIKIKMEIDTNPPLNFATEAKQLYLPIPFSVLTYKQDCLFAGKVHAILCRNWNSRVKGRDWYDFYWYVSRQIPVNLTHLKSRLIQSGHFKQTQALTQNILINLLQEQINKIDFEQAKKDVAHFLRDQDHLALWSQDFFKQLVVQLRTVE